MITYSVGCAKSNITTINFPSGEVGVRLLYDLKDNDQVTIKAHLTSNDEIIKLLLVVDAMKRQASGLDIKLKLPYVPYARQDRVCNEGESLSISVFANLINSCGFTSVEIIDPHSDVTPALINNVVVVDQIKLFRSVKQYWGNTYIVAPDAGAYKKAHKWAEKFQAKGVITANKVRDVRTGRIESVKVHEDVGGLKLLVVDDLLDAGGTFLQLVGCLPGAEKLELYVTHGIFSKGLNGLTEAYDHIYTTNSFHGDVPEELKHDKITWINV